MSARSMTGRSTVAFSYAEEGEYINLRIEVVAMLILGGPLCLTNIKIHLRFPKYWSGQNQTNLTGCAMPE